ncbi:CASP-like protein 1C1 [Zingiber officinale]|uniref:CASP-like protein 1C1 n=1 Tax=Zingiber officinale TaxID=94328 RepID=UPI001C4BD694|nr:CASP-like protein 1C1 [Zingiber officinale]
MPLLLRLLAAAATLCATIIVATSHDSTMVFGLTLEAKFQHTPALNLVSACVPSTSLLSRLVIVPDVILAMLLTASCRCSSRSHGTAREGRQQLCRVAAYM